ncbi:MAG: phosphoribosylformylglycinamidine synthase II, partial [Acidimicrobiaceae bacterium]|nr:phosphoribosylformylglycinamidine synthase II [Acidimicrobiaceae bacterium]
NGADIDPTPVVTTMGVVSVLERRPPGIGFTEPASLVLIGETQRNLAGSRWAYQLNNDKSGSLPNLDLRSHRSLLNLILELVRESESYAVSAIHDVSDGGLALALAEMAIAGDLGVEIAEGSIPDYLALFSESASRVLVATSNPQAIVSSAAGYHLPARVIGDVRGSRLYVPGLVNLTLQDLRDALRRNAVS